MQISFFFPCAQVMWAAAAYCMWKPSHRCRTPQRCSGWSATVRPRLSQTSPACHSPWTAARRTSVGGDPDQRAAVLDLRFAEAPMTSRLTWAAAARKDATRPRRRRICQPKLRAHASLFHPRKVGPVDPSVQLVWLDGKDERFQNHMDKLKTNFTVVLFIYLIKINHKDNNNTFSKTASFFVSPANLTNYQFKVVWD